MKRIEVASGDQYGDLQVIREVESADKRKFLCKCSCGNEATIRLGHLTSGHSTTCGRCGLLLNGERKTIAEWAKLYGINKSTLRARLKVMELAEALKRK